MKFIPAILLLIPALACAQSAPLRPPQPPFQHPPGGKFWDNPEVAKRVGITAEQQRKMDDVFLQNRIRLVDLHASLEKDQLTLEGLMQGPQLDDSKILPVIDRIAQDRAELEKADARMLLGIRHILTPEQWTILDQRLDQRDERGPGQPGQPGQPGRPGTPPSPPGPGMRRPNAPPPPPQE